MSVRRQARSGHRRRRLPRLASVRAAARPRPRRAVRRQLLHRPQGQHRRTCSATRTSSCCATTSPSRSMSRSTRSTTSPARPRRSTTSSTRCRRPRPACIGAINMLGLAKRLQGQDLPGLDLARSTATRPCIRSPRDYWGNVNPIGPRACYDEGKRCAETLFFDYHRQHKLRIKVARIFNTYGPRMHPNDGRVVSNFIVQALKGEPITIYGDGTQTRVVLLRRRSDRGLRAADGHARRRHRPDQPRQSRSRPRSPSWPSR